MSDIRDAQEGDIFVDPSGKLWRIVLVVREPTVEAEEVEGTLWDPNAPPQTLHGVVAAQNIFQPPRATINKTRRKFPISDALWNGWQRIWGLPRS